MDIVSTPLQTLAAQFLAFLPKLVVALIVFFVGLYVSGLAARGVKRALEARKVELEVNLLLSRLTQWSVVLIGAIVALQQVNFNLTGFLAGLGILGFAIGIALQDVSKNFVAGILLLVQQPFGIGDFIEVQEFSGTVTDIDIRATEILTLDGIEVLIPNGDVYVSPIKNYSRTQRRRLELAVGVAYESDLDRVTQTVQTALSSVPGVVAEDPAPQVVFGAFGVFSIDLKAYFWIDLNKISYLDAQDQSIKVVKTAFEQAGIVIPHGGQRVWVAPAEA